MTQDSGAIPCQQWRPIALEAGARRDELWIEGVKRIIKSGSQSKGAFIEIAAKICAVRVSAAGSSHSLLANYPDVQRLDP